MSRLAFLGPPGTFAEEAGLEHDPQADMAPMPSVTAVAAAVESGMADEGVVPIENSLEGSVPETLDILIRGPSLFIKNELVLPIEQHLLVRPGAKPESIGVIYSHPQALAQCRSFIERCFPRAAVEAALSTAAAVKEIMGLENAAAIGNLRAAQLYGAYVLARGIQDSKANVTRFVVLAREDHAVTGDDKTSIALTFAVEDRPGLLVSALQELSARSINMTKIESRPSRERLGTYIFLVEVSGHRADPPVTEALECVKAKCSFFRILGSYPRHRGTL